MLQTFISPVLIITLLLISCLWVFQYFWNRRNMYRYSKNVPGPKGLPLVGLLFNFGGGADDIFPNLTRYFSFDVDLIKAWLGPFLFYSIQKPEHLKIVLNSSKALSKMYLSKFVRPLAGYGIFSAPVDIWRKHRKIVMPAFNKKILDSFVEIFARHNEEMCQKLESFPENKEFDLFRAISKCNLNILTETSMGLNCQTQAIDPDFEKWVDKALEIVYLRIFKIGYHFDFIFKWTNLYKIQTVLIRNICQITERIIREKKIRLNNKNSDSNRKVFFDLLMGSSVSDGKLTEEELKDELHTFLIAGSATATPNTFVLLMLALHPEIQEKVYEEIVEIIGLEKQVESEDLPFFEYTERVIKETLRLFPVAALIARDLHGDITLEDGVILPKGSSAILCILAVHRNPKIWPQPLIFDPDRFLPEEVAKRHPYSYIPFSGGPRNCVGPEYAMRAMKVTVATVIRKFKFFTSYKSVKEIELKANFFLRPKKGYKIYMQKRT